MDRLNKALVSQTKMYPFSTQGIFPPDIFLKGSIQLPSTHRVKIMKESCNIPFLFLSLSSKVFRDALCTTDTNLGNIILKHPYENLEGQLNPVVVQKKTFLQFMHLLCQKLTLAYKVQ